MDRWMTFNICLPQIYLRATNKVTLISLIGISHSMNINLTSYTYSCISKIFILVESFVLQPNLSNFSEKNVETTCVWNNPSPPVLRQ